MTTFSAAILAGGRGQRMGQDKAFLPVGGVTSLERVMRALLPLTERLLVVTDTDERHPGISALATPLAPSVRVVTDLFPGTGALGAIYTALQYACAPLCLVVGCDMPFLNPVLLQTLVNMAPDYQAVVPRVHDRLQPLHAVYHRDCLHAIEADLQANHLKAVGFLDHVRLRLVPENEILPLDPHLRSFMNMNTPEEWRALQRLAGTHPPP